MSYSEEEKTEVFEDIIERIAKGESLRGVLKDSDKPSSRTFFKWLEQSEDKQSYLDAFKSKRYLENSKHNKKGSKSKGLSDYRNKNASKVNKKRFPNSDLYILKIENQRIYKIGVSQNIDRRHKDIANASPFNVELIYLFKVNNAYDLEDSLHLFFIDNHIKNEWFNLTTLDLEKCLHKIKEWK